MYRTTNATEEQMQEIEYLHKKIEEKSCELRCLLEELQDLMWQEDIEITDCFPISGEPTETADSYQVEDWADKVSEIESFFEDCE